MRIRQFFGGPTNIRIRDFSEANMPGFLEYLLNCGMQGKVYRAPGATRETCIGM